MRMEAGSDVFDFFYDHNGDPYSVKYNGTLYYYILNLQGDVVRIVSANGTSMGTYRYDVWGNILYQTNAALINKNPLRYRGYIYDNETGFYYLQSRYYDPKIGRFLNADSYASTGQGFVGYNMYAYCNNSPVKYSDVGGNMCVSEGDGNIGSVKAKALNIQYFTEFRSERIRNGLTIDSSNFNIMNSDPEKVIQSNYLSAYKGIVYIKVHSIVPDWFGLSFGVVFIGDGVTVDTVKHEYGHTRQLFQMGIPSYLVNVAYPSVIGWALDYCGVLECDYYSLPWEYQADIYGDVNRENGTYSYHSSVNKYYARYCDYLFFKRVNTLL